MPSASEDCASPIARPHRCCTKRKERSLRRPTGAVERNGDGALASESRPSRGHWRSHVPSGSARRLTTAIRGISPEKRQSTKPPQRNPHVRHAIQRSISQYYSADRQFIVSRQIPVGVEDAQTLATPRWGFQSLARKTCGKLSLSPQNRGFARYAAVLDCGLNPHCLLQGSCDDVRHTESEAR